MPHPLTTTPPDVTPPSILLIIASFGVQLRVHNDQLHLRASWPVLMLEVSSYVIKCLNFYTTLISIAGLYMEKYVSKYCLKSMCQIFASHTYELLHTLSKLDIYFSFK